MFDPEDYSITTRRTLIGDGVYYESTVGELPDVAGFGATRAEAEEAALEGIKGLQNAAMARGKPFPPPVTPPIDFTGRVTLRMSKSIHQRAAFAAVAEHVSLNSFIVEAVVERLAAAERPGPSMTPRPVDAARVDRIRALVAGVEFDLNAPLSPADD